MSPNRVRVVDARGKELSPTEAARAHKLVAAGKARFLPGPEPVLQLPYEVDVPEPQPQAPELAPGTQLLLHICCGPCATYPVPHLRELGVELVGWWYNPNIQPGEEYALREESARRYAGRMALDLAAGAYEPERYEEAVRGHTARPERCQRCYRLRLEAAARAAAEREIEVFSTALLISPYQDQEAIREAGEAAAAQYGRRFYFENMRRGYAQRGPLARAYGLYLQEYCGCRFSLAERREALRRGQLVPEAEG